MTKQNSKKPKKSKKAVKRVEKHKFPKIYRIITEKWFWPLVLSFLVLIAIAFSGLTLYETYQEKQEIMQKREKIIGEIKYWEDISIKYKGYRDAYYKLATLQYQIEEKDKALENLEKVLNIDPNFEPGLRLKQTIENN
ncbi:MAG: tetratricopeptide repeat protein [Patescibacteria group bacterium]|nr:tetratricopeptide repeat protein [Patescibacteria group bacterium]